MIYQERFNRGPFPDAAAGTAAFDRGYAAQIFRRGDIYLTDLGYAGCVEDHIQGGVRPVIILQNDACSVSSPTLVVVPVTSRTKKKPAQSTHCLIRKTGGLSADSVALGEQITTINKKQCLRYLGKLSRDETDAVLYAALSGMDGFPAQAEKALPQ